MNLQQALTKIAAQLNLDAAELIAYANEDTIGGWDPDAPAQGRVWHPGSIFENEGKVLYALAKALKVYAASLIGKDTACARGHVFLLDSGYMDIAFTDKATIVFDDGTHKRKDVADLARRVMQESPPGTVYIIHDTHHPAHRDGVRAGIADAGMVGIQYYLIEPSDCGIGIWQKPVDTGDNIVRVRVFGDKHTSKEFIIDTTPDEVIDLTKRDTTEVYEAPGKVEYRTEGGAVLYVPSLTEAQNEALNEAFTIDTIDTATTGELKALPGIGSRAVAKIREVYPFVSDDE